MKCQSVLVVACLAGSAMATDPVTFDFFDVGGEWGVFADDGVGGLNSPNQGTFSLSHGLVGEIYSQEDGIALAQATLGGELLVQSDASGAVFAGDIDLGVLAQVDGDGPGDNELAIANLGLTSAFVSAEVGQPVLLTVSGRPVIEVYEGLGQLDEGVHELLPGYYGFNVSGASLFLDATAGADEFITDSANFAWSMRFGHVPSAPALAVFGIAGGFLSVRRRR